jgi:hypothetical protein
MFLESIWEGDPHAKVEKSIVKNLPECCNPLFMAEGNVDSRGSDTGAELADALKVRELDLRERELVVRERETASREKTIGESKWSSPLILGLLAAALGLLGNSITTFLNNRATKDLEDRRAQSTLILEAIKTGKPAEACTNLVFFVKRGLIRDPQGSISSCSTDPATSPVLPSQGSSFKAVSLVPGSASCVGIEDLNAHVYNPDRLQVKNPCIGVSGTVVQVRAEADGDYHMQLQLDPGQDALLSQENLTAQGGNLVLEAICEHTVAQADAKGVCKDFQAQIKRPRVGQHVAVVGRYVLDAEHGWMEIHPVLSITETPQ